MKGIFLILFATVFFSCSSPTKNDNVYYYKAISNGNIVSFEKRSYKIDDDFITENITVIGADGNTIEETKNKFKKLKSGYEVIINDKASKYLLTSKPNQCAVYEHPMMYEVKNCYEKTIDYKGYKNALKYTYSEEVTDGLSMTIYRDKEFALIDKVNIIGMGNYDELIRIKKSSIPPEIEKSF